MTDTFTVLPWMLPAAILLTVVVVVLVLYLVLATLGALLSGPARELTLADRAEPYLRLRTSSGRADAGFERFIRGTMLGITAETAVGWILLSAAVLGVVAFLLTTDELYTLVAIVVGGLIPVAFFFAVSGRRRLAIQDELPDGCFQLSRSLRSGLNLRTALSETAAYLPVPLSDLFTRLATALTLGEAAPEAVQRVADDAAVGDFDLLAAVIGSNVARGGNLPVMLDRLAASIRDRNQYRGYFRSVTTLSRISAIFLALAFPAVLILYTLIAPDMFEKFVSNPLGKGILTVAVILEIIGIIWMYYLTQANAEL